MIKFKSHWSGKETFKTFERWKAKTPVTIILYFICNYIFLGWNWKIIRMKHWYCQQLFFRYIVLPFFCQFSWNYTSSNLSHFLNLLFLHSWYGYNHLWKLFFFLVIAVTTSTMLRRMFFVLIQNFLNNLLLNIKPNWSVCDKH